jgi:transcriptional regulator with XRE-family HTH domain
MRTFDQHLQEKLESDARFRAYWERSEPLYGIIKDVLARRDDLGLTQAELAARMGKKQPAIARFEAGNAENPTLSFLHALADALDMQLSVRLVPKGEPGAETARLVVDERRIAEERTTYSPS